jgi:hypothetical protein
VPVPETVRDSVQVRLDRLSEPGRRELELAAAAGVRFRVDLLGRAIGGRGLDEAIEHGFLAEAGEGEAAFRHALVQEAVYSAIPWSRRRAHHHRLAEALEEASAAPELVAEQWLGAHELDRARPFLLAAADAFCAVHAYRDAARVGRLAIESWPRGVREPERRSSGWATAPG